MLQHSETYFSLNFVKSDNYSSLILYQTFAYKMTVAAIPCRNVCNSSREIYEIRHCF